MKFVVPLILLFFLCDTAFGQKYPQTLLDSFCNETIRYYHATFLIRPDSNEVPTYNSRVMYVLKGAHTTNLKTNHDNFTVCFVTREQALEEFVKTEHRTGSLENLHITQLRDTIDVDFGNWVVEITEVKWENGKLIPVHSKFSVSCGGTLGYIPTCRFIFDNTTNRWTKYTWQQIANESSRRLYQ